MVEPLYSADGRRAHGKFKTYFDEKLICISRQPLLDAARWLLANRDFDPGTKLTMRHKDDDYDALTASLGEAAKWTVREDEKVGPVFARYKALGAREVAALDALKSKRAVHGHG